jgi:protein SCO1/2
VAGQVAQNVERAFASCVSVSCPTPSGHSQVGQDRLLEGWQDWQVIVFRPWRSSRGGRVLVVLTALTLLTSLTGACSTTPHSLVEVSKDQSAGYAGTLLTPAVPRPDLTLADISGGTFSLARRPADEITAVFFGYTHCPDVCPTTMADLAAAKRLLPEGVTARLKVVFVTEDPRRDTPPVLREWLDRFDPTFLGLIGGGSTTSYVLNQLHLPQTAFTSPTPAPSPAPSPATTVGRYGVSHSGIVYVFAHDATVIYTGGTTPRQYAADLIRLARRTPA